MHSAVSASSNFIGRPSYSCIRCAERKVKCDRNTPCSTCVRHNVDCQFNTSQPPRNRRKHLNTKILTDRLRHYESLLREKNVDIDEAQNHSTEPTNPAVDHSTFQPEEVPNDHQGPTVPSSEPRSRQTINKAQVIQTPGRYKLVNNILWTRIVEELHDSHEGLVDGSDDDSFHFMFSNQPVISSQSSHPSSTDIIHQLWQIFVENVDPLTKIVHVPSLRPAVEKAAEKTDNIPRSFDPLMFSIYSAAIMSLSDDECQRRFHERRTVLLSRYTSATEVALSRAKFMGTTNLVVLQALIIHLLAIRDIYELREVWSLTGVAVRIAQGMGLDRDGVYLGLSPFEIEIRRRIWWQLKMHDFRTAELCGIGKFQDLHIDAETTKWPANVNDDKLYPGMPSPAKESNKLTDVVFVSLKCEFLKYAATPSRPLDPSRHSQSSDHSHPSLQEDTTYLSIEFHLEAKYLRYVEPSNPLHLLSLLMARSAINTIHFMTHHPRRWTSRDATPVEERQKTWKLCLRLLEQHNALLENPLLKRFAWYAEYFRNWHAVLHVLDTLRAEPFIEGAERAWELIDKALKENVDAREKNSGKKIVQVAVGRLCLKAWEAREAALALKGSHGNGDGFRNQGSLETPQFIVRLRQEREAVIATRQGWDSNSAELQNENIQSTLVTDNSSRTGPKQASNNISIKSSNNDTPIAPRPQTHDLISFTYDFGFGFDDGPSHHHVEVEGTKDLNNLDEYLDLDSLMEQNNGLEETGMIDWVQWDAWLAGSDVNI